MLYWKEYMPESKSVEPIPIELSKSPTWKPTASRINDQFQLWMLPLAIVSFAVYAGIWTWKLAVLGWNFLRRHNRS